MNTLDRKLWRDLARMKSQALAIALVVMCGVGTYVMFLSTLQALRATQDSYYRDDRFAELFVSLKRAPESLRQRVQAMAEVDQVETRVTALVRLEMPAFAEPVTALMGSVRAGARRATGRTLLRRAQWAAPGLESGGQRAAFIVGDVLSDSNARARTFGTDSVLATRFWTAVKTGTNKDMRDNWAIGWSQRYSVGVWVGNASGAPMWDVSGTTGAAPIWAALMNYLHQTQPSRAPHPPVGLVQTAVQFAPADPKASVAAPVEAARLEWFLQGTQQSVFTMTSNASNAQQRPRITSPTTGTIIALDPDIPPKRQRVNFSAEGTGLRWRMDGQVFGQGASAQWLPWPGRHVIQIADAKGLVLDQVRVEVRGAGVIGKR